MEPPIQNEQALGTLFAALRDFAAIPPLQLTAHEVALERCRLAVEWQAAISEAAVLLFERTDTLLTRINTAAKTVLTRADTPPPRGTAQGWNALQHDATALLHATHEYHQVNGQLRGCLVQLGAQIQTLEGLSCQLVALADTVEQSRQRLTTPQP